MGVVFKAYDLQLRRTVALKIMKPALSEETKARERFLNEARSMASIRSDHVVTVHQVGEQNDVPYLAMEFLNGLSMDQWLSMNDFTPARTIVQWAIDICEGLASAHRSEIVHRDIKPANLWIEEANHRIKILDFGLAYAMGSDRRYTRTGQVIGTLEYMAPEQLESTGIDVRSDLFSVGCVLYQLASGTSPFSGPSHLSVLKKLSMVTPPPVQQLRPDIPHELSRLITQLLDKSPARRPVSAGEVGHRLKRIRRQMNSCGKQRSRQPGDISRRGRTAPVSTGKTAAGHRRVLVAVAVLFGAGALVYIDPGEETAGKSGNNPVVSAPNAGATGQFPTDRLPVIDDRRHKRVEDRMPLGEESEALDGAVVGERLEPELMVQDDAPDHETVVRPQVLSAPVVRVQSRPAASERDRLARPLYPPTPAGVHRPPPRFHPPPFGVPPPRFRPPPRRR